MQQPLHHFEIRVPEFLPFGCNCQRVGPFQGAIRPVAVDQLILINRADVFHRLRIVHAQRDALGQHGVDEGQGRRFANIIRARLERKTPDGQRLARQAAAKMPANLGTENVLLRFVHFIH